MLYFMKGRNAIMRWDYKVEDAGAKLKYIIWSVQNKTTSSFYTILFEDNKGNVNVSTQIPQMYVGRVEKTGRATFVIRNLIYEDSAKYTLTLDQTFGEDPESVVQLAVTGPASLSVENQFSAIGDSVTFTCNAINVPGQNFTWMIRKGEKTEKILSDAHYSISSSGTGSSQLRITNVSAVDEGRYICNATVRELNEASGYLQVLQDMSVSNESCPNLSYDVRVGTNDLKLCCPVSGYPKPLVTWERNGVQLQRSENPLYFISKVKQEDFGNYTCTATDGRSFIASAIRVRDKIAKLPVETTDETDEKAANLKWAQQTGADYYVVKINGTDIHPDVLIGKQTFLEVHYHTLVLKNNKQDAPETTVCVEVSAFDSTGVIARTTDPSCKTMVIKKASDTVN